MTKKILIELEDNLYKTIKLESTYNDRSITNYIQSLLKSLFKTQDLVSLGALLEKYNPNILISKENNLTIKENNNQETEEYEDF